MTDNWIYEAYRKLSDYNNIFAEWRTFDRDHAEYIKSTIGLMLFGIIQDVENPPQTVNYYLVYTKPEQKIIDVIFEHIKEFNRSDEISLSCTHLVGKTRANEDFIFPVLRFRAFTGEIYFTELSCRLYKSWKDFLSSNQLPACDFIAPVDGLYTLQTPVYLKHISPAASTSRTVMNTANRAAIGGTAVCAGVAMTSVAPVTVAAVGIGLTAFSVGQSISHLIDRKTHRQSIALDNRESLLSYGNIIVSSLAGVSTLAVSNLGRLQRIFGNSANTVTTTCKVLNISTIVLDSGLALINAYDFVEKLRTNTFTYKDAFDFSLQIFLVCGAVVQAREIHAVLQNSQTLSSGTMNKKLTRTQKRNLQKRRAKARARGEVAATLSTCEITDTLIVGENDLYSSLRGLSLRAGSFGVRVMMAMYPRAEVVLNYYYDLRELITATFQNRTMDIKVFLQQVFYHTRNLYLILRQDITRLQEILRRFIPDPTINNNESIALSVNNEIDRINLAAEESMPMLEAEDLEGTVRQDDQSAPVAVTHKHSDLILKFVYETCVKYRVFEDTADAQLSFFHTILVLVSNYYDEASLELFNTVFERNVKVVGEEKANIMTSLLGTKTENDFHPSVDCTERVLLNSEKILQEFMEHSVGVDYEAGTCSSLAREIFEQYSELIRTIYGLVSPVSGTGVKRMVGILIEISFILANKLAKECRKISSDSHTIYQENIEILGEVFVEEMMKSIEMPTTESGVFRSALGLLNIDDLVLDMKSRYDHSDEPISLEFPSAQSNEDKSSEETILELISTLYTKIEERKAVWHLLTSKQVMYMNTATFVAEKLITELKLDAKVYEGLKTTTLELVGPKLVKAMLEAIGMYASEKSYLFKTKVQLLASERSLENMVIEFMNHYCRKSSDGLHPPKIFETTIGDDGFTTYKIMCDQNGSDDSYKELVNFLFGLNVNELDCKIVRDKRCVVVNTESNVITFSFPDEENVALVILTDLDRASEQKESSN